MVDPPFGVTNLQALCVIGVGGSDRIKRQPCEPSYADSSCPTDLALATN